ncbi:helix-turn-helix transcriptional regulator [Yersinia bercovieri]|uniref:DNA-binding response regulator n=2 Tax=Yersinia bercovieri TaxID=634 RepID=A0A2G4TYC3_YERBE|nr:LuxR C-terminal-related transcriptional regulator [Yersinia bercovieri]MCB5304100.1 LuxR C-terminal-related transcriptional regulator [Yersinia bercovieri]PHZ26061.1 DNA-binding response regulator [Yersinia bercovieri]QKJ05913.1 response regulator transcription factor [Yersinia bercovieri ATCC 43970]
MMSTLSYASKVVSDTDINEDVIIKQHRIVVIGSNHFRSTGLRALLSQLPEKSEVLCEVASVMAFHSLPFALRVRTNLLIIHPDSFEEQDLSGIAFLTLFLRIHPHCRVFMMADVPSTALLAIYHALGVATMLPARGPLDVLQATLRAGLLQTQKPTTELPKLTPRELTALQSLLAGMSVAKLARQLGISCKTIYTQRSNALQKLGLRRPQHMFDRNALPLKQFIYQYR